MAGQVKWTISATGQLTDGLRDDVQRRTDVDVLWFSRTGVVANAG